MDGTRSRLAGRPGDRLRPPLERPEGDRETPVHPLAVGECQQVLRLAATLREGERAQQLGAARPR